MNKTFWSFALATAFTVAFAASAHARPGSRSCQERDFGALKVGSKKTGRKNMRCNNNEYRRDQYYTGTNALDCRWDLRYASAELECYNPTSGTKDADHTYLVCCRD
jgi:hypothetical protein